MLIRPARLTLVALAILCSLAAAGCGGSSSDDGGSSKDNAKAKAADSAPSKPQGDVTEGSEELFTEDFSGDDAAEIYGERNTEQYYSQIYEETLRMFARVPATAMQPITVDGETPEEFVDEQRVTVSAVITPEKIGKEDGFGLACRTTEDGDGYRALITTEGLLLVGAIEDGKFRDLGSTTPTGASRLGEGLPVKLSLSCTDTADDVPVLQVHFNDEMATTVSDQDKAFTKPGGVALAILSGAGNTDALFDNLTVSTASRSLG